jgi:FKBP-type peptidyl-prolyl cis-trans isomerase
VTKNGDIKKCILVEGVREGGRPVQGDVVLVKSQGKLKDGTMIDDYPTLVFRVGEYEVIEGLDLVVQVSVSIIWTIFWSDPDPRQY